MGLSLEVRLFFEFLQVAVGNRKSLSVAINDSDWQGLFEYCKRQALIGVGFSVVEKLHTLGIVCPANLRMQWMALALQIEQRNALLNEQCRKLTAQYGHDGLATCILKGQGNCLNYPEELRKRRMPGDIDVWTTLMKDERLRINDYLHTEDRERHGCPQADYLREQQLPAIGQQLKEKNTDPQIAQMNTDGCPQADVSSERELPRIDRKFKEIGPQADGGIAIAVQTGRNDVEYVEYHGRKAVIEYVRMQHRLAGNNEKPVIRYHHIEAPKMEGTEVEVHFRVGFVNSPLRNFRMQRWFDAHADVCMKNKTHMGFAVPTSSVNVVYQMCHLFTHYFDEGLGLRQLMDYYFALRIWHNDVMECKDLQSQGMWSEGLGTPVMSATEIMAVLRSFGMGKFAGAVMWVLQEAFENEECRMKKQRSATEGKSNEECSDADGVGEQQLTAIGQQLKEIGPQADSKGRQQEQHKTTLGPQADGRSEREFTRINRELKEIGPQADEVGEQQLTDTAKLMSTYEISNERIIGQQLKEICPQSDDRSEREFTRIKRELREIGPQADGVGEQQLTAIGQQLKKNKYLPWMICEPNEKEGRKLMAEIMQGGNFGQYDTRDAKLKRGGMVKHGLWKLKRVMRLVSSYPEEALWEPVFRVYHLVWRGING